MVGRASDAVEILTASSIDWQATRSTLWLPFFLPRLARVHAGAWAIRAGVAKHQRSDEFGGEQQRKNGAKRRSTEPLAKSS